MSSFDKFWAAGEYFQTPFQHLRETIFGAFSGGDSEQSESSADSFEFNDNVIGNNAAILLTDDAQNTVNFLYVNPIEFFNNGRASDIHINYTPASADSVEQEAASSGNYVSSSTAESSDGLSSTTQVNGNVIGNNAAILLTDDAQNTVNFLYINPIEFFNNGRASDIYININSSGDEGTNSEEQASSFSTSGGNEHEESSSPSPTNFNQFANTSVGDEDATGFSELASCFSNSDSFPDDFGFLDEFSLEDVSSVLDQLELQAAPLSLLEAFGVSDAFDFDNVSDEIADSVTDNLGDGGEVNDNVIGNNAAILLTDNAQSTVNFLYINPIQFFNDGRAGDIYLDITLGQDDGLVML